MPFLHWLNNNRVVKTASNLYTYCFLLEEVPVLSYGDADNRNMLIQSSLLSER